MIQAVVASTVVVPSLNELVRNADTIAEGVVEGQTANWGNGTGSSQEIYTTVTIRVSQVFKGAPSAKIDLKLAGGQIGNVRDVVQGAPQFENGATYLLFIQNNGKQLIPLVAMTCGQFKIVPDTNGVPRLFDCNNHPVTSLDQIGEKPGSIAFPDTRVEAKPSPGVQAIPVVSFAEEIRRVLAEQNIGK